MKRIFLTIITILSLLPFGAQASFLGILTNRDRNNIERQIEQISYQIKDIQVRLSIQQSGGELPALGADTTLPLAGTFYTLSGSGVSGSATSIGLTSLTIPQTGHELLDSEVSDTFYVTLEPGSRTRQEIVSCTTVTQSGSDNTATLSGCTRGLLPFSPYTASSSYRFAHGGGTSLVFSNPPQLYNDLLAKGNAASITGVFTFTSSSLPRSASTPIYGSGDELKFVTYGQLASTSFSGTVNASLTQKGIGQIADQNQITIGSSTGATAAENLLSARFSNSTSSATTSIVATKPTGKISQGYLDLTEGYAWTGTHTFASSSVFNASTTFTTSTVLSATGTTIGNVNLFNSLGEKLAFQTIVASISGGGGNNFTELVSTTIPGNTLGTSNGIRGTVYFSGIQVPNDANGTLSIVLQYGTIQLATSTIIQNQGASGPATYEFTMIASSSASAQRVATTLSYTSQSPASTSTFPIVTVPTQSMAVDSTASQTLSVYGKYSASNGSSNVTPLFAIFEKIR